MEKLIKKNQFGDTILFVDAKASAALTDKRGATAIQIAEQYLDTNKEALGLGRSQMLNGLRKQDVRRSKTRPLIAFAQEKLIKGATVVVYAQSIDGMPVFDAQLGVQIDAEKRHVMSVQSSVHANVKIYNTKAKRKAAKPKRLAKKAFTDSTKLKVQKFETAVINRQMVYRYEDAARIDDHDRDDGDHGCFGGSHSAFVPNLPKLKGKFKDGQHYIVDEILWSGSLSKSAPPVNWRVLVEPLSGEVLYVRAFISGATALVYDKDPQTLTGDVVVASDSTAVLDSYRTTVTLEGLVSATPQELIGEYAKIEDLVLPTAAPPTVPTPAGSYSFSADTDDFAAVNAYHHVDRCFRTMVDFGYIISDFFPNTTFPIPVDHRGEFGVVNAHCRGNVLGNGIGEMTYGLISSTENLGIATSNRVVWHEFGHGILYDNVSGPNYGFAHSAGDSMAVIMNDPGTNETDRFDTFPYVQDTTSLGRRHDRDVTSGWAWFGANYNTGYNGEQILCTTLFRLYQAIGGDAAQLNTQIKAAESTVNMIFGATGLMTSTTTIPEVFVVNMQNTDLTDSFKGDAGGALHKVVRWAFEKQGLYHPDASPGMGNTVAAEGNPPDVDVYIDDGRQGEYEYQWNHWSCQDMWVRLAPDGGLTHEVPIVNQTNYMYVRVKNRGLLDAENVTVDAYSCLPGTGLVFPDDWVAMTPATLAASGPIAPGGFDIVGPFEFTPTNVGHECLLAISHADGDPGNDTTITGSIDHARFIPFDNNIGQRNVHPVEGSSVGVIRTLTDYVFWIRNPTHKAAIINVELRLPRFMQERGWELKLQSQGGQKFELSGRERRKVRLAVSPGKDFSPKDVKLAARKGDADIHAIVYVNGEISGGMSYPLALNRPSRKHPNIDIKDRTPDVNSPFSIEDLLTLLKNQGVGDISPNTGRRIRSVRLDFDDD